jgi:uncharacterized membrane protein YdjX (TVP38/TMEM64 family)
MEKSDVRSPRDLATSKNPGNRKADQRPAPLKLRVLQHLSWLLVLGTLVFVGLLYLLSEGFRNETAELWSVLSSGNQEVIRDYIRSYGAWAPIASVLLMVSQVIVAPVPASVIQLSNGVVFGIVGGTILNLVGQMAGAMVAFYISRSLGRAAAERLVGRIDQHGLFERWLERWGARALLIVRLVPGMPSDFVSYLMGLTSMPARRYFIVSAIGFTPQSLAYAWLGEHAIDWFWWIVLAGFGISSVIALVIWSIRNRRRATGNHKHNRRRT